MGSNSHATSPNSFSFGTVKASKSSLKVGMRGEQG